MNSGLGQPGIGICFWCPILTHSMALMLVVASLSGDEKIMQKALRIVDYHLRRNYCTYKSHSVTDTLYCQKNDGVNCP
jgi:hypothetical protein